MYNCILYIYMYIHTIALIPSRICLCLCIHIYKYIIQSFPCLSKCSQFKVGLQDLYSELTIVVDGPLGHGAMGPWW